MITASPLLYSTLKLLEEWESIFTKRLDSLGPVPDDFFARGDDPVLFQVGPALTRQKFILEPENSPFRYTLYIIMCMCVYSNKIIPVVDLYCYVYWFAMQL